MIEWDDRPKDLITRIKYKYWEIWPHYLRPMTMWYNFKCWAWHRYSTIRARRLPHTWCDRRELLLHISFEILVDFIDGECSPGHVEWYGEGAHMLEVNGEQKNVMDEMLELKHWWEKVYNGEYPEKNEELWEAAEKVTPIFGCVHEDDMPDCVAGRLVIEYNDDEQRDAYHCLTNEIRELERHMDEQAEVMLKRLAAVRLWMWT